MRLPKAVVVPFLALALAAGASAARAETTRNIRVELSADALGHFAVENLAGTTRVAPATIHAETDALADSVKFEQVAGRMGVPTLRVRYPLDEESSLRYPGRSRESGFLGSIFGGNSSNTEYDGHKVKISDK